MNVIQKPVPPPSVAIQNALNCAPEKRTGILNRVFADTDKPKITEFKLEMKTAGEPKKKEGLFKKIGNLFKRKDKKKKIKKGSLPF